MKEEDYIKATNLTLISTALRIIKDIYPGKDFGFPEESYNKIIAELNKYEHDMFYIANKEEE